MSRGRRTVGTVSVVFGVLIALVIVVAVVLTHLPDHTPLPGEQRCVLTASGNSAAISTSQAHYASIIAGVSIRRGLPPRAASIALATAYQESRIDNLDHGDRDSVGLFQQRPSQGWGTKKQLMDPYYATRQFYRALVKIPHWQTRDITEIAQQIQVSGYPEAYRAHEQDARVLASVLTGQSPAGIDCLIRDKSAGNPSALDTSLQQTFRITPKRSASTITITATSGTLAWAYAQYAVANAAEYGVIGVRIGDRQWHTSAMSLAGWKMLDPKLGSHTVKITTR